MTEFECCDNCHYFKPYEKRHMLDTTEGECRRYPPRIYQDGDILRSCFTGIMREDWCGEYDEKRVEGSE